MIRKQTQTWARTLAALAVGTILCSGPLAPSFAANDPALALTTTTPIKHLVVIFQENSSFDHYFGTYPNAANTDGTTFTAAANTPSVNGLNGDLLNQNPNKINGFVNPFRFTHAQAVTNSQNHSYGAEEVAFNGGLMNNFQAVGSGNANCPAPAPAGCQNLGYFDGNTVTALWNWAQNFAMSDNHFGSTFGPSTPGALNLIAGQTHGTLLSTRNTATGAVTPIATQTSLGSAFGYPFFLDGDGFGTQTGDLDPGFDDCGAPGNGTTSVNVVMAHSGTTPQTGVASPGAPFKSINVGNLLSAKSVTWGWFQGGFRPSTAAVPGTSPAVCGTTDTRHAGLPQQTTGGEYNAHHEPFMYYASTSNPHHLPPSSTGAIGTNADQANHNYDLADFQAALAAHNLPAVVYLKASNSGDGHPGNSDPLSEQTFLVNTINMLMQSPEWNSMAIVIEWDDSDGWYDHVIGPIVNPSNAPGFDFVATGTTTGNNPPTAVLAGSNCGTPTAGAFNGRCGYGPRFPFLVISPWAKVNYVDHTVTDQSSVLKFVEENWLCNTPGSNNTCASAIRIDDPTFGTGITNPAQQSFDVKAGSLMGMFDFSHPRIRRMTLDASTGAVLVP